MKVVWLRIGKQEWIPINDSLPLSSPPPPHSASLLLLLPPLLIYFHPFTRGLQTHLRTATCSTRPRDSSLPAFASGCKIGSSQSSFRYPSSPCLERIRSFPRCRPTATWSQPGVNQVLCARWRDVLYWGLKGLGRGLKNHTVDLQPYNEPTGLIALLREA